MKTCYGLSKTVMAIAVVAAGIAADVRAQTPVSLITATMDGGTAETGNTWYGQGQNTAAPATGLRSGFITGQTDPLSTYFFRSGTELNALMLDTATTFGTLTFTRPVSVTALSLAGASGNGSGTIRMTLRFSDNSTNLLAPVTVGDWFNSTPIAQTAAGRINAPANTYNNVGAANPRVLAINATLSAADAAKTISAIDLAWTGSGANTHTAIFGVSGDVTGIGHFTAIPLTDGSFNQDMIVELIPEPGTYALLVLGAGLLGWSRRKRS